MADNWGPLWRGDGSEDQPAGGRRGPAAVCILHRDVQYANPERTTQV